MFKELFYKYQKLEKEINNLKESYTNIKNEKIKLHQENLNLKNELEIFKNRYENDISLLKMQSMNINNNINMNEPFDFNNFNPLNTFNQMNNFISQLNLDEDLNIIFDDKSSGVKCNVVCKTNDLISSIIDLYKIKKGNNDEGNHKYLYDGKEVHMNLTVGQSGLNNGSIITDITLHS